VKKCISIVLGIFILYLADILILSSKALANTTILSEDFNDGIADNWIESGDWGTWSAQNGEYIGTVKLKDYPEKSMISYFNDLSEKNYIIQLDVKNTEGVDKAVRIRYDPSSETYYGINLRSKYTAGGGGGNDINLGKSVNGNSTLLTRVPFENLLNKWYEIEVSIVDNSIKIYIDDILKIDFIDENNPIDSGTVALQVWPGGHTNPVMGNNTTTHYDNIIITSSSQSKLIFLPGMTACWNKALLTDTNADDWILPFPAYFFVYKNLIDSFNNAGLVENKDWYLFCYDWRKPLQYNSGKLNNFVQDNISPGEKINLVGHSMGGLVGRTFTQAYPDKANKAITLGSPHQGAVRAYPAWEAGQLWEYDGLSKLLFEILLWTNRQDAEHPMRTIRRIAPSIQDLLPTFDFLIDDHTSVYKNINTHIYQNLTLNQLNNTLGGELKTKLFTIAGKNQQTLDTLKVTSIYSPPANWVHQHLGLWEDGEPVHNCSSVLCEYTDSRKDYSPSMVYSSAGDKTVLVKSATINGVETYEIDGDHNQIVQDQQSIGRIFDLLDIPTPSLTSPLQQLQKAIAFLIRSPAKITIIDPTGKEAGYQSTGPEIEGSFYDDQANVVIIPNYLEGIYKLETKGTASGNYQLLVADLNDDNNVNLREYQFATQADQVDYFYLDLGQEELILENTDYSVVLRSATSKIENIRQKIDKPCGLNKYSVFLNKIDPLAQRGKYREAAQIIKIVLTLLNQCVLSAKGNLISTIFPSYESIINDLTGEYINFADKGNLKFNANKLNKTLFLTDQLLVRKNQEYKRISVKNQISLNKVILFEKAAEIAQEAKEALKSNQLAKTSILLFQVDFLLLKLN